MTVGAGVGDSVGLGTGVGVGLGSGVGVGLVQLTTKTVMIRRKVSLSHLILILIAPEIAAFPNFL